MTFVGFGKASDNNIEFWVIRDAMRNRLTTYRSRITTDKNNLNKQIEYVEELIEEQDLPGHHLEGKNKF